MSSGKLANQVVDLRDYFAAAAVSAVNGATPLDCAQLAFDIADKMIEERSKPQANESPLEPIKRALAADDDYAWTWFCNISMLMVDSGVDHDVANNRAAGFMNDAFAYNVRKLDQWKQLEKIDRKPPKTYVDAIKGAAATIITIARSLGCDCATIRFPDGPRKPTLQITGDGGNFGQTLTLDVESRKKEAVSLHPSMETPKAEIDPFLKQEFEKWNGAANPMADVQRLHSRVMAANQEGLDSRTPETMRVCHSCGNKRCPNAKESRFSCTGSNEPGQIPTLQNCEDCLYSGKPCPECLPEWERANREV